MKWTQWVKNVTSNGILKKSLYVYTQATGASLLALNMNTTVFNFLVTEIPILKDRKKYRIAFVSHLDKNEDEYWVGPINDSRIICVLPIED